MDKIYLQEAFQAMKLLEEEDFRLDDVGVKDILDFKDHDELNDIVDVIDPEADTKEELNDSYIGSVILECEVCHSPIFKKVEDVEVDEDGDLVNIEEECPICHSNDGFKIIGQVAPFKEDPEVKVEVEDKEGSEEDQEDARDEEDFEEKIDESLTEDLDPELEEKLDTIEDKVEKIIDQVCEDSTEDNLEDTSVEDLNDQEEIEATEDEDIIEEGLFDRDKYYVVIKSVDGKELSEPEQMKSSEIANNVARQRSREAKNSNKMYSVVHYSKSGNTQTDEEVALYYKGRDVRGKKISDLIDSSVDESINEGKGRKASLYDKITKELYAASTGEHSGRKIKADKNERYEASDIAADEDGNIVVIGKTEDDLNFAQKVARYFNVNTIGPARTNKYKNGDFSLTLAISESLKEDWEDDNFPGLKAEEEKVKENEKKSFSKLSSEEKADLEKYKKDGMLKEPVKEGFEKVDLEMEDKIIHVSEEEKPEIPDAEMIVPVSDELESELVDPIEDSSKETALEPSENEPTEQVEDEPSLEETNLESDVDTEDDLKEDEADFEESLHAARREIIAEDMIDYSVEDFDEINFNKLGESYLKSVYDNINSFNTTNVIVEDNEKMIIEGVIKFASGKEKATQFIFEAKEATKSGAVKFIGENAQISRGKKSFTLSGKMDNSKFIAESLNYNYMTNSNKVYGTVKIDE